MKNLKIVLCLFAIILISMVTHAGTYFEPSVGEFSDLSGLYYGVGVTSLPYGFNSKITIGNRDFGERSGFSLTTVDPNASLRTANFSIGWPWDVFGGTAAPSRDRYRGRRSYRRR